MKNDFVTSSRSRRVLFSLYAGAALFVFAGTPSLAPGQTATRRVLTNYKANSLSIWPNGSTTGSNLNSVLLGPSWNLGNTKIGGIADLVIPAIDWGLFTTPEVHLGKTGIVVNFGGTGEMGLAVTPWYQGGALNMDYQGGVSVSFPRFPIPGQQVTATASFSGGSGSWFQTTSPRFGASFESAFKVTGYANSEGYIFGAKLWDGDIFKPFTIGGDRKRLSGLVHFDDFTELNVLLGNLTPIPVSAELFVPDTSASAWYPDSSGVLKKDTFGKFLSLETDLLSWIAFLCGADEATKALYGNYTIPGSSLNVGWNIAKAYANLDFGFTSSYTLTPHPQIGLKVYDANGSVLATGGPNVTFTMPTGRVTIVPSLTLDFTFRNKLGFGTGGSIGFIPIELFAKGKIGSGDHAQTYDIDFNPAEVKWEGNPSTITSILDKSFQLPWDPNDRTHVLPSIGINAANLLELPREVFAGSDTSSIGEIPAYSHDSDKDYFSLKIYPEQGRKFFASTATFGAVLQNMDGGTQTVLNIGHRDDTRVDIQLPTGKLQPGHYNVIFSDSTKNSQGQPRSASWVIPLTAYLKTPNLDGELNKRADLDATSTTNRIIADGTDHWIYCGATGIYKDSVVLLNGAGPTGGPVPLETDITSDQDITGKDYIGFKIPANLAAKLAGKAQTIQVVNKNLRTDANGAPLPDVTSSPKSLFFVSKIPTISNIYITSQNPPIAIGDQDVSFDVNGTNFTQSSNVYFVGLKGNARSDLSVTYSSPTTLRVTMSKDLLRIVHNSGTPGASLYVETPTVQVPTVSNQEPSVVSGGTSKALVVKFAYPTPKIGTVDSSILIRGAQNVIRVTGANLFKQPEGSNATLSKFVLDGHDVPRSAMSYPTSSGITVPYIDIKIPANDRAVERTGTKHLEVYNGSVRGSNLDLICENGAPVLVDGQSVDCVVAPGVSNTFDIVGGPFYPESKVFINGTQVQSSLTSVTKLHVTVPDSALSGIDAPSTTLVVFTPTPGGGQSGPMTVRLHEQDASKFSVVPGSLTFDRATSTYRQPVTVTYKGHRMLDGKALGIQFRNLLTGITLTNSDGTDEGYPYKTVTVGNSGAATFTAVFRKTGANPINYTNVAKFR